MKINKPSRYDRGNVRIGVNDTFVMAFTLVPYFTLRNGVVEAYASLSAVDASKITEIQSLCNEIENDNATYKTIADAKAAHPKVGTFLSLPLVTLLREYDVMLADNTVPTLKHGGTFSAAVQAAFPGGFTESEFLTWASTNCVNRTLTCALQVKYRNPYNPNRFLSFLDYNF